MDDITVASEVVCPICTKEFVSSEIEEHVNRCLFLNSQPSSTKVSTRRGLSLSGIPDTSPNPPKKVKTDSGPTPPRPSPNPPKEVKTDSGPTPPRPSTKETDNRNETSCSSSTPQVPGHVAVERCSLVLNTTVPLAEQLRPSSLQAFVGQEKVVGSTSVLRKLLANGDITSMVLWGPPGCGKTSLAHIIACKCRTGQISGRFVRMSAVTSAIADVKEVVKTAKNELTAFRRQTILFMDEIHRFNKLQQDVFLPHVESGCIILIGATTENPSFSLNSALLSRCRVFVLEKLTSDQIFQILTTAVERIGVQTISDKKNPKNKSQSDNSVFIQKSALEWLAHICDGDARIALNSLQLAVQASREQGKDITIINLDDIKEGIKRSHMLYDRAGEEHYNVISAMHKSIRASDQNATLYWLTRMLQSGEDPRFIARRLVRAASEDIGLADSSALPLAVAAMQGCQLLGMPECDVLLAQCAVYLARAPKSREVDAALAKAKELISNHQGPLPSVPLHLRNAPTRLMKDLGYGSGYSMVPSEVPDMVYMPEGMEGVDFFRK